MMAAAMPPDTPHILLVNPWIHDFAAYDFWAKPLGLLTLAGILRHSGCRISYIDCLDRFHPRAPRTDPRARDGRGPYLKTAIARPAGLDDVPRTYSRYGIRPEWLHADLAAVDRPDLVLVTSMMTYWYPGVRETVAAIRALHPGVPLLLGGVYATLCSDHAAAHTGADRVVAGAAVGHVCEVVAASTGIRLSSAADTSQPDSWPFPAFDLQSAVGYVPLLTTIGCPFGCSYCAAGFLNPTWMRRSPESVLDEIEFWCRDHGVTDFVFYDDALLVDAERHAMPLFEGVIRKKLGVRFHTPNAVHISEINTKVADLMFAAGFKTLRIGLETAGFETRGRLDAKVTAHQFAQAVDCLRTAGFGRSHIGAYLLFGLPGQRLSDLAASIRAVHRAGITPIPAYYTPIPHTALWPSAVAASRYDLEKDPLFCNNAILPCRQAPFSWNTLRQIRELVRGGTP
jgi:radical SAM superfamily enzyme YgiQ (UPF0313 family)